MAVQNPFHVNNSLNIFRRLLRGHFPTAEKKRLHRIAVMHNPGVLWQMQLIPAIVKDKQVIHKALKLLSTREEEMV
jgi:hypothetical protein